jgi:hypothetical protein
MWQTARKRVVSILALVAFIAATLGTIVPHSAAATIPCVMAMTPSSMAGDHVSSTGDPSSNETLPPCGSDLRCIIAVALPEVFAPTSTDLVWDPVHYWDASNALVGLSIPPDISPPRSRA